MKKLVSTFLILPLLVLSSCRDAKPAAAAPAEGIARVGKAVITRESFQDLLNARSRDDASRFSSRAAKEQLLDELIRREALFAKAQASGFDQRPDVQEAVKRLIAAKFQDDQMARQGTVDAKPSDTEITQYYQQHADKYAVGAKVHGAIIFLKISPSAEGEKREQRLAQAQTLLDRAKTATAKDFARLVEENSEDQATRYRGGDIGWVAPGALDPAVNEALFRLHSPGDFAPLVSTKRGVYIVKLLETQPAGLRPLAEVKEAIAFTLRKQKQREAEEKFFASVKSGLEIQINDAMLEAAQPPAAPRNELPRNFAQIK